MARICYQEKDFRPATMELIYTAIDIVEEYAEQGFTLSLRQLYYQLVARGILPNKQTEYKRLGRIINDARIAGLIDWLAIVDRSRALRASSHWNSPSEILDGAARQYQIDKWSTQPMRIEVWIEKDALVGVIGGICKELDVPFFSCRGYPSVSSVWEASERMREYLETDQPTILLHLADHDPSGIDMTRDLRERLELFLGSDDVFRVTRLALTIAQVQALNPPPNPAKLSDSRAPGYVRRYGRNSWELDALEPAYLVELIESAVVAVRDDALWKEQVAIENAGRQELAELAASLLDE